MAPLERTSDCSSLLIYRPRKDERLSWPCWLTCSGRFTHITGHSSDACRAQVVVVDVFKTRECRPCVSRRVTWHLTCTSFLRPAWPRSWSFINGWIERRDVGGPWHGATAVFVCVRVCGLLTWRRLLLKNEANAINDHHDDDDDDDDGDGADWRFTLSSTVAAILQASHGNFFYQNYNLATVGDKYELIRFWGQKIKGQGHDESKCGLERQGTLGTLKVVRELKGRGRDSFSGGGIPINGLQSKTI